MVKRLVKKCPKIAQKRKSCFKLLELKKVAPNAKSCLKVAEHNRAMPTHVRLSVHCSDIVSRGKFRTRNEARCDVLAACHDGPFSKTHFRYFSSTGPKRAGFNPTLEESFTYNFSVIFAFLLFSTVQVIPKTSNILCQLFCLFIIFCHSKNCGHVAIIQVKRACQWTGH